MKIAQIAPSCERLPPLDRSDPGRALSYIIAELVRRGHEVTLFASRDSRTSDKLEALYASPSCGTIADWNQAPANVRAAEQGFGKRAEEFDIIHSHMRINGFPMAWGCTTPTLTTLQHRLDLPEYVPLFKQFRNLPLVSISDAQRRPLAWASWQQTIYQGVPSALYRLNPRMGNYLAFFGDVSRNHDLSLAIEVARRAQLPLRIASRAGSTGGLPLHRPTELLIADHSIEWLGELREQEKNDFLKPWPWSALMMGRDLSDSASQKHWPAVHQS